MSEAVINAAYPAGMFDSSLIVQDGNPQVFEFLGEYLYSPLYKMMPAEDIKRLETALKKCDSGECIDECVKLINERGEYTKYLLSVEKYPDRGMYYIEFRNVRLDLQQASVLKNRLSLTKNLLTVVGGFYFTYRPQTKFFRLFWMNYEQSIDVYDADLDEWAEKVVQTGQVEGQDKMIFDVFCEALRRAERSQSFEFRGSILTKGKTKDAYRIKFTPCSWDEGKVIVGSWMIINEQTGNEIDDYVEGSYVDSMTRILNKRAITEYAEEAVAAGKKLALIVMDIDNFKDVNDTYGHMFGDQVIAATADVIKKVIGENGAAGRVGGDEFMVVLASFEDELDLRNYLRGIKTNVASLFQDRLQGNKLSCSIGASRAGIDADNYNELFRIADKALYIAKQKGKNRFIIYKKELHGQFNVSGSDYNMVEIRDSFYSEKDLNKFNELLAETVLNGSKSLSKLLEHAAHTLMVGRLMILWGEGRKVIGLYPPEEQELKNSRELFEGQQYLDMFKNDMLIITNVNMLEFTMPEVYAIYRQEGVTSLMQHLLRDEEGRCMGMVIAEEHTHPRHFPKLAQQLFMSMSRIINAVLIKESLDK